MSDEEFINSLTSLFVSAQKSSQYVSLRLCYEDGQLIYFLTNQPRRKDVVPESICMEKDAIVQSKEILPVSTRKPRGKQKRSSTSKVSPEVLHSTDKTPPDGDVSTLSVDCCKRRMDISVPCHNDFDVLENLDNGTESEEECDELKDQIDDKGYSGESKAQINDKEYDSDERRARPEEEPNRTCEDCLHNPVPYPWNRWCGVCYISRTVMKNNALR